MKFTRSPIGVYIIDSEKHEDERGFFARVFDVSEFEKQGLETTYIQHSISLTRTKGTVRGIHYQAAPHEEAKLIRCTKGAVFDVTIDMRPDSPTFEKVFTHTLVARCHQLLYIPKGIAHGFQTITHNVEMSYCMTHPYHPEASRGICWNDPYFRVQWPLPVSVMSKTDASIKRYTPQTL